jgi:hypothetical protein
MSTARAFSERGGFPEAADDADPRPGGGVSALDRGTTDDTGWPSTITARPRCSATLISVIGEASRISRSRCQASAEPDPSRISRAHTPGMWAPWGSNPQPAD